MKIFTVNKVGIALGIALVFASNALNRKMEYKTMEMVAKAHSQK